MPRRMTDILDHVGSMTHGQARLKIIEFKNLKNGSTKTIITFALSRLAANILNHFINKLIYDFRVPFKQSVGRWSAWEMNPRL